MPVYFNGAESAEIVQTLVNEGVQYIAVPFFYVFSRNKERELTQVQRANPSVKFLLDPSCKAYIDSKKKPDIKGYLGDMTGYLGVCSDLYQTILEPDFDAYLTIDEQRRIREAFWGESWGEKVIPVWKFSRGIGEYKEYLLKSNLRAIGITNDSGSPGYRRRLVLEANRVGKEVIGVGISSIDQSIPFEAITTHAWLNGRKFGRMYVFHKNTFHILSREKGLEDRKLYRKHFESLGLDPSKIENEDTTEVTRANILAWKALSDRMDVLRRIKNVGREELRGDTSGDRSGDGGTSEEGEG